MHIILSNKGNNGGKNMKKLALLMVLVLTLGVATACGGGSDSSETAEETSLADLQEKGVMQVGMCPEYPPFESINSDGEIEGFDVDLANAIGEILGVKVEFVNTPYEGLIAGLQNNDFDIIMSGMSPEEAIDVEGGMNVSENYYAVDEVILTKDENIKSKEDLAGKVVGSHGGSTSEYAVDSLADMGIEIAKSAPYNRHSEAFADLQNGNIDAQVVESTWAHQKVTDDSGIMICEEPINSVNMAAVMNFGQDSFTQAFNDALAQLKENGKYDEIVAKWFE